MLKLLYTYIKSLFIPTDITLTLNGSQLTFTKEGDIKLAASRNLITQAKYIFQNCTDEDIKVITSDLNIPSAINEFSERVKYVRSS